MAQEGSLFRDALHQCQLKPRAQNLKRQAGKPRTCANIHQAPWCAPPAFGAAQRVEKMARDNAGFVGDGGQVDPLVPAAQLGSVYIELTQLRGAERMAPRGGGSRE